MKLRVLPLLFPLLAASVFADTFGSGANQFEMGFVEIGNPGNTPDNTGFGAVGYTYQMGVNEVSRRMITSYNALSGGPAITLSDMTANGGNGTSRPATGVSWNEAARFVNWLNTSRGYSAAYNFTTGGASDNIALWVIGDSGYNPSNPFRNARAHYFLPSDDEWYKAAYYDPNANGGLGSYWDYATGSDTAPTAVAGGTTGGTVVYGQTVVRGPADITNAGGLSPYGTMAQNGNVSERLESGYTPPNDLVSEGRVLRGGWWYADAFSLRPPERYGAPPQHEDNILVGFRVAAVPEPAGVLLALIGMMGGVLRRKR